MDDIEPDRCNKQTFGGGHKTQEIGRVTQDNKRSAFPLRVAEKLSSSMRSWLQKKNPTKNSFNMRARGPLQKEHEKVNSKAKGYQNITTKINYPQIKTTLGDDASGLNQAAAGFLFPVTNKRRLERV